MGSWGRAFRLGLRHSKIWRGWSSLRLITVLRVNGTRRSAVGGQTPKQPTGRASQRWLGFRLAYAGRARVLPGGRRSALSTSTYNLHNVQSKRVSVTMVHLHAANFYRRRSRGPRREPETFHAVPRQAGDHSHTVPGELYSSCWPHTVRKSGETLDIPRGADRYFLIC